jgi:hypothetical protein
MTKQLWSKLKEFTYPETVHREARDKAPPKVSPGHWTKVEVENRVCSKCGDNNFLSGVLIFERSFVTGLLCRKCLDGL